MELQKRFFDYYLKGEKNGWNKEPRVWVNLRRPFTDDVELRKELVEEGILTLDGVRWSDGYAWCELQEAIGTGRRAVNIRYLWASECSRGHGTALLKKIVSVDSPLVAAVISTRRILDTSVISVESLLANPMM